MKHYEQIVHDYVRDNYYKLLREPMGQLNHKFIVPGATYTYQLWDWDSWLTDVAITQIALEENTLDEFFPYQQGCIANFLEHMDEKNKWIPIMISDTEILPQQEASGQANSVKPVLAQHILFIGKSNQDFKWVQAYYEKLKLYLSYYDDNCLHESGLYFFVDDTCIGVDNDPCTFYRPKRSSGSIFLNCLMHKELLAMAELAQIFNTQDDAVVYRKKAETLKAAVREHCYDERNGFYYSVDLNLLPIDKNYWLHSGCPRNWSTLIQRIDVWSGFMAMWSGIADEEQAKRMVEENYLNARTFYSDYGIRSLSKCEKMYQVVSSTNPSCWLGPIWGIANYILFKSLVSYGYNELAEELIDKVVSMYGRDIEQCGEMHEYYDPETGEGVRGQGFQSWNLLCANMIAWKNGKTVVEEF